MTTRLEQAEDQYARFIAPFIEAAVERDAALMERVYERKWGSLDTYFDRLGRDDNPSEGPSCGCLVGSTILENGTQGWNVLLGFDELRDRLGLDDNVIQPAALAAPLIASILGSNEKGVKFLKAKLRAVLDWHKVKTTIRRIKVIRSTEPVAV